MTDFVAFHLDGKPEASLALYRRFVELIAANGPYTISPSKTTITFKGSRRGFAGARPTANGLHGYFDVQRVIDDARITRAAPYGSALYVHHFRVASLDELDNTFASWIAEAYAVGGGAHLR